MAILQTRIFAHHAESWDWAETLMGRVLKTITHEYREQLDWYWFSRYVCKIGMQGEDRGDCAFEAIPAAFKGALPGTNDAGHRSLRFRFEILDEARPAFEERFRQLLTDDGYAISDIRPYDEIADTGSARFLATENAVAGHAQLRARLVTHVYYTTSQLLLDTLVGPDANRRFRIESNQVLDQNPNGSTFESVHHVFCNISAAPTSILFFNQGGQSILRGTYWGEPRGSRAFQTPNGQHFTEIYIPY